MIVPYNQAEVTSVPNPYLLMTALYLLLAAFFAIETTFANLGWVAWFNGLRWLRVHFITLGGLVEIAFGILPALVAAHANKPKPGTRWDIWALLNVGLIALGVGIPLVNAAIIFAGGTLIFIAAILLLLHLRQLDPRFGQITAGRPFYVAGLSFLLLGIIYGTGLWLGWGEFLRAAAPKEIHLHANLWGFASLTIAGLLIDLYPGFAGRAFALPRSLGAILGLFLAGDLLLVFAPWIGNNPLMGVGLLLHHAATALLVFNFVQPLAASKEKWNPGLIHLVAAYAWMIVGLGIVPIAVLGALQVPFATVETHAPLILVFGWVLQWLVPIVPYIFSRALAPDLPARLAGTWSSVLTLNLGTASLVAAIISEMYQALFGAIAFGLWAVAILLVARAAWQHLARLNPAIPG